MNSVSTTLTDIEMNEKIQEKFFQNIGKCFKEMENSKDLLATMKALAFTKKLFDEQIQDVRMEIQDGIIAMIKQAIS